MPLPLASSPQYVLNLLTENVQLCILGILVPNEHIFIIVFFIDSL
jgi:hypothetical protein